MKKENELNPEDTLKLNTEINNKGFDYFLEHYKPFLKDLDLNLSYPSAFAKYKANKFNVENAEDFEIEKFKKEIEGGVSQWKKVLSFAFENLLTRKCLFENDKHFLSNLYFYLEYKRLLKIIVSKKDGSTDGNKRKKDIKGLIDFINHENKEAIVDAIKIKCGSYKGKEFNILRKALLKLDLIGTNKSQFGRCLKYDGFNFKNIQMLEERYFVEDAITKNGNAVPSKDGEHRDRIVVWIKEIINA